MLLNGLPNITQAGAGPDLCDAKPEAFKGYFAQAFGLNRNIANLEHSTGIAVIAVFDCCDIKINDVAILELLVSGNAMADLMVD